MTVVDENDLGPEFSMDTYTLNVDEDTPINTRFQVVSVNLPLSTKKQQLELNKKKSKENKVADFLL